MTDRTTTRRRRTAAGLTATAALLALSACSSSSGSGGASATSTPAATSGSASASGSATVGSAARISIKNFTFVPATLAVSPGAKVTVTNQDTTTHTVTATTGKLFDTGDVPPGRTATFTAPGKPGTYDYICSIHQFMMGTLKVA
ncbi:cupredoxin domain-containing protein [Streptomyces sp. V4-01]|uniref:Cupredoxin domain-containing protein n=1 Tax=Actinacidiphila polyblastidii TaxID=3110430 RepID=A0ABU7PIQ5_9ACTN|nr:cupredoxin domain-containing protein [Streptomyces sp. V4-01]